MKAIKDPQTQECLKAAFHGEIPKDLEAEEIKKAEGAEAVMKGATAIDGNDELAINQIVSKMRGIVTRLADQSMV